MHRSLRYPLAPHEKIYFLHIPKTAGTTLFDILKTYFEEEEILSIELEDQVSSEEFKSARLFRSHYGYDIYPYFSRPPVCLTMLRDPVKRVVSNYMHWVRHPTASRTFDGSLEDFVATAGPASNWQTYHIVGKDHEIRQASEDTILSVAKAHLESFTFFGITERFDDSLRLMTHILGWDYPRQIEPKNIAHEKKPEVPPAVLDMILKNNQLDIALYDFAQSLFEERFQRMNTELSA